MSDTNNKRRTISEAELLRKISNEVEELGVRATARVRKRSATHLWSILNGRQGMSALFALAYGYWPRKTVVYVPVEDVTKEEQEEIAKALERMKR
jgi:hypothetical protein